MTPILKIEEDIVGLIMNRIDLFVLVGRQTQHLDCYLSVHNHIVWV